MSTRSLRFLRLCACIFDRFAPSSFVLYICILGGFAPSGVILRTRFDARALRSHSWSLRCLGLCALHSHRRLRFVLACTAVHCSTIIIKNEKWESNLHSTILKSNALTLRPQRQLCKLFKASPFSLAEYALICAAWDNGLSQ